MPSRRTPRRRPQDQREAFLRDLRGLRERRGLSLEELAARSGSTPEQQAAVETGPWLPSLPALESYLRGCGEQLARWEDRWRRLTRGGLAAAGDLPVREPGTSPLAVAGRHWQPLPR
ncbi:MAG TPA: helix-turn-helix transcriptional regulator [Trebonia sp.]